MIIIMPNAININPAVRAWALCAFDGKHCILNGPLKDKTQVFNPQNLRALPYNKKISVQLRQLRQYKYIIIM